MALFDSEAGYREAIDAVLDAARHELRLFDRDIERMVLEEPARHQRLVQFLAGDLTRRLKVVLHDPAVLQKQHPRLLNLIRSHGHQIEVRHTPDHLRHLADCFVLADSRSGAIRFHADHARGKCLLDDDNEIHPYWQRFDDLWESSQVCTPSTAGL